MGFDGSGGKKKKREGGEGNKGPRLERLADSSYVEAHLWTKTSDVSIAGFFVKMEE
jgi:hypothetical protein